MKLWKGRTNGNTNELADKFNSSINIDKKMFEEDALGSIAHVKMLSYKNILTKEEETKIILALEEIIKDIKSNKLQIDESAEDIHMFMEQTLINKIGDVGKKVHTARSRNDQVTLDLRLYLIKNIKEINNKIKNLIEVLVNLADKHKSTIMPGYTHLQRAQAITFGQHLLAYASMFLRDIDRFNDTIKRTNISPIGSCALAGTTFNTDRFYEAKLLGFEDVCFNSMDGVSDRDYCCEFLNSSAILMMHLSRISEELVMWSSWEFQFIELSNEFTTGSSIMPQKKNPDMAELIRGKTGRVYGNLVSMLTILKGLPLAYNKDLQEDKEKVFDTIETLKNCLDILSPMLSTMKVLDINMKKAVQNGFVNATDVADYLVIKGLPFRTAYNISGKLVDYCIKNNYTLESLPLKIYKTFCELFEDDLFEAINVADCVNKRLSYGGTSVNSVQNQINLIKKILNN